MVIASVPTKRTVGSSLIGSLSRSSTGGLEIIDFKEGGVDLLFCRGLTQTFKNLGFDDQVGLMCFGIDNRDGLVASLDRVSCSRLTTTMRTLRDSLLRL